MSLLYKGSVYKVALTPEQKELKKEYLLQQQKSSNEIPSFEYIVDNWEALTDYSIDTMSIEMHVTQYMRRNNVDEDEAFDVVIDRMVDDYDAAVARLNRLQGRQCWRVITTPAEVDPAEHTGLGVYWSYRKAAAKPHWSDEKGQTLRYRARIDLKNVDLTGTVVANIDPETGADEKEVRFLKHVPIYVYDVEVLDGSKVVETIPIKAWRRC